MKLELQRIILFAEDVPKLAAFYRDIIGLAVISCDEAWAELDAGRCRLALHGGGARHALRRSPKIVFGATDVEATRTQLMARGAKLGKVKAFGDLRLCDGKDPEGNPFQISDRPAGR